jgi:predicted house-cleaning noncanonical NTP pyrophosphatase (MazG superfamily)
MSSKLIRINNERDWMDDRQELREVSDPATLRALLVAKLHEEASEVGAARGRDALLVELADCYEVIHTLAVLNDFSMGQVIGTASRKADDRGPLLMSRSNGSSYGRMLVSK